MFVKIEPTGCIERKGLVQIRFSMYLDEGDYGYEKHHIQVPVIPPKGYQGEVDEYSSPVDVSARDAWLASLPKVWQLNPFHNLFIYVEPGTSDKEIMNIGQTFLEEAYIAWSLGQTPAPQNPKVKYPVSFDKAKIETKIQHLKTTILERRL